MVQPGFEFKFIQFQSTLLCLAAHSVMSDSLLPCGLQPTMILCPWGFSRQEYWSELPFLSLGDLLNPGIEPRSPAQQVLYHLSHQGSPNTLCLAAQDSDKTMSPPQSSLFFIPTSNPLASFMFIISLDRVPSPCIFPHLHSVLNYHHIIFYFDHGSKLITDLPVLMPVPQSMLYSLLIPGIFNTDTHTYTQTQTHTHTHTPM